ncbi:MAG: LysR family transcriptional regulator [Eggerthellaceae bacterium]|nr:LysR family transcriptional regulator [Eggerthellaceae bacterium]
MDVQLLEEFFVFAQHLNVSVAAKELHISQPTLSKHIKSLEREFGKPLVNHEKEIRLTSAGLRLANYSTDIVSLYRELREVMAKEPDATREIKVAYDWDSSAAHVNVAVVRNRFFEQHPDYRLTWTRQTLPTVYETLSSGEEDCAMVYWGPVASDLKRGVVFEKLPSYVPNRLFLWVGTQNIYHRRDAITWEEAKTLKAISTKQPTASATALFEFLERHGVPTRIMAQTEGMVSDYFDIYKNEAMVLDEQRTTFLSVQTVPNRKIVLVDEPDAICGTYLAYLPGRVSPALQVFLDFLHALPEYAPEGDD